MREELPGFAALCVWEELPSQPGDTHVRRAVKAILRLECREGADIEAILLEAARQYRERLETCA